MTLKRSSSSNDLVARSNILPMSLVHRQDIALCTLSNALA